MPSVTVDLLEHPTREQDAVELTILMPCLDEAETVGTCVAKALHFLAASGISGEVVVADNGSTDGSREIASRAGARIVEVAERGYGAALLAGVEAARGTFVIMGDSDDSYDFLALQPFVDALRDGNDLVMGNRFTGGIAPGAMPPLHRYLGNPVLSFIGRRIFLVPVGDFHCGLRGFRRSSALRLGLSCTGMEFASELVVKARVMGQRIAEVPTTLSPDGRSRPPHLRSWHDGWRHLRFLLLFSPRWLFLYPGLAAFVLGTVMSLTLLYGPVAIGSVLLDVNSLVATVGLMLAGHQALWFAVISKSYATRRGILPADPRIESFRRIFPLERTLLLAAITTLTGVVVAVIAFSRWRLQPIAVSEWRDTVRLTVASIGLVVLGLQTALCALLESVLSLPDGRRARVAVAAIDDRPVVPLG